MSKPNFWDEITAYVVETLVEDTNDDLVDDQKLDCDEQNRKCTVLPK